METVSLWPHLDLGAYGNGAQKGENLAAQRGEIICPSFLVVKCEIYLLATVYWPKSPGLEVYLLKVECLILVLILPQNKVSVILVL